jgi:DNA (cytosine-5)-methyltransferase 1
MKKKYNFIDLFAGAGGLSEGFVQAGFNPLAHVEMNKDACNTLRTRSAYHYLKDNDQLNIYEDYLLHKNIKDDGSQLWTKVPSKVTDTVIQATISEETIGKIFDKVDKQIGNKTVDLIIGGPPCQAYSVAGRARMGKDVIKDPRNELYKFYVKFLERYQPKMFVFENVKGILTAKGGEPFRDLCRLLKRPECGYEIDFKEQVASDYGVLQDRHRIIIVGWKATYKDIPTNLHYPEMKKEKNEYQTLRDLFSDLPIRKSGEGNLTEPIIYTRPLSEMNYLKESGIRGTMKFTTQHIARPNNVNDREIYMMAIKLLINEGKRLDYSKLPNRLQHHKNKETFRNRFQVVNPFRISHTLVAHIAMDGHYYIYPTLNPTIDNVRSITVREAARIQSFPDDFYFEGSRSQAFKQIGNAVPVLLAYKIAIDIKKQLLKLK